MNDTLYIMDDYYPAIIDKSKFSVIQENLDSRAPTRGGKIPSAITGIRKAYCGYCQGVLVSQSTKRNGKIVDGLRRARCGTNNNAGSCITSSFRISIVESAIAEYCSQHFDLSLLAPESNSSKLDLAKYRLELKQLDTKIANYVKFILYLFNFNDTETLTKVHKLKTTIKGYERNLKAFNSVISQDKIVSSITSIRREIAKLERSLLSSEKGIDKLEIVSKINAIDDEQNTLSDEMLSLDLKIKNIIETNKILRNNEQVYLLNELQSIYEYASVKIESTLEDYRQALAFHNHLLNTKLEFVSHGLDNLQDEHEKATVRFAQLNNQKHILFDELKSKKKIEEISDAMKEIGKLDKELAKLTAIIDKKDDIDSRLFSERKKLTELSGELEAELTNVTSFEQNLLIILKSTRMIFMELNTNSASI